MEGAGEPVLSDDKTGVLEIVCYFWMAMLETCIITVLFLSDDIKVNFWLKCDFLVFMISLLSLFVTASYGTFKTEGRFPLEALPFGIMAVINCNYLRVAWKFDF